MAQFEGREAQPLSLSAVLADAQAMSRRGTRLLLERRGYVVAGETDDGSHAVQLVRRIRPTVLITALNLQTISGIEVIRQVHRTCPATAICVLTEGEACDNVVGVVRAGAGGYVLRQSEPEEFCRALDAVTRGETYICPRVPTPTAPRQTAADAEYVFGWRTLTQRERQVADMAAGGLHRPQIASVMNITTDTVNHHLDNLLRKLGLQSFSALVLSAVRRGRMDTRRVPA